MANSTLVSVRPALIDSNSIIHIDFGGVADGSYWVVVRASGYLALGSTSKIALSTTNTATYDFTTATTQAQSGTNSLISVSGSFNARGGDFNWDMKNYPNDYTSFYKTSLGKSAASIPAL